jgi:acyl-CoA synthetase (AMP-forming)/AMP-acid ligase II/acyl carrier protein/pimeloyl-ACP methyl ester carboxylesterase
MHQTLVDCISGHRVARPDKVFWRSLDGDLVSEYSFAQLFEDVSRYATSLSASGVLPGDVVLIFLPHGYQPVAAFLGVMMAGALPSFMAYPSAKQHPEAYWSEHRALFEAIGAVAVMTDRSHAVQMREHGLDLAAKAILTIEDVRSVGSHAVMPLLDGDGAALLQHSSGTTSLKKGVILSHRTILRQVAAYSASLGMTSADNIVSWLPLYHDMGLIACCVTPLVLGQTVTSLDPFHWVGRPASLLDAIARYDGRFVWMPNFAFEHLVRTTPDDFAADLSRLRAFINCSEPCKPETFERFAKRFSRNGVRLDQLQVCYAMAETVFAVSQTEVGRAPGVVSADKNALTDAQIVTRSSEPASAIRLLSAGRVLPGLDVRIFRDGREVGENSVGEVSISGEFLFDGYFNRPDITSERLIDGRYFTRDRGFIRVSELYILGRIDELLIINGRNIQANEVEAIVSQIRGVKPGRAVAFGVYNEWIGSEELVVVAERDPHADDVIDADVLRTIRNLVFEMTNIEIKTCELVEPGWLKKTTSGKIARGENLAAFLRMTEARSTPSKAGFPSETTLSRVAEIIAIMFGFPASGVSRRTVAEDVDKWDSLAHASLMLEVEKRFAVRFRDDEIFSFPSVGDLVDRLEELLSQPRSDGPAQDRVVYTSPTSSILRWRPTDLPDVIIFAGRNEGFGRHDMQEFASVYIGTEIMRRNRYHVTDHGLSWYTEDFEQLTYQLNRVSQNPKILIGSSMGGYAALRFAGVLQNVISVMAFCPQHRPIKKKMQILGRHSQEAWTVDFYPRIPSCIIFGEKADLMRRNFIGSRITDPDLQRIVTVPGAAHNAAAVLQRHGVLARVLECSTRPDTMIREVDAIISALPSDAEPPEARTTKSRMRGT